MTFPGERRSALLPCLANRIANRCATKVSWCLSAYLSDPVGTPRRSAQTRYIFGMLVAGCPLISAMMQASKDLPFAISRKTSPPPIVTPSTMAAAMTILVACTGMSLQRLSIWRPYARHDRGRLAGSRPPRRLSQNRLLFEGGHGCRTRTSLPQRSATGRVEHDLGCALRGRTRADLHDLIESGERLQLVSPLRRIV